MRLFYVKIIMEEYVTGGKKSVMNTKKTKATVLIVDDIKFNRELMISLLEDSFEIKTAAGGAEALEIMHSNPTAIDVVLLDMIMPQMNGCEVLEQMNTEPSVAAIPVIVVTTDDDPYTKLRAFDLGAMDFVQRGADVSVIKHRINNVIRLTRFEKMTNENEQMKKALNNEHRFTAFMDNIPGGVAILRTNKQDIECSYFNKELLVLFGMTGEEFKAQFSDPYRPEWIKTFLREGADANHFSYAFPIGDSSDPAMCQWVRLISGKLGETDGVSDIYCVFLDINDEKRHEMIAKEVGEKLRENEDKLEALLDNSPGGIVYAERDTYGRMNVKFVNRGISEMLEYPDVETCVEELSADATVGVNAYDVSVIRKKLEEAILNGTKLKHTFNCTTKKGKVLWLMLRAKPMLDADGRLCLYTFITNTTKEKQIEEELRTVAYFDPLTGLFNRSAFIKNVRRVLDENPLKEYSLMKLNIGSFKTVNDLMGRDTGDRVLKSVADVLRQIMGKDGIYARFFADSFCLLVPYSERSVHPQMIIDALQTAMKKLPEITHEIQFYIGVYKITDKSLSVENMADRAAIACRSINGSYREHIAYYDEKMRLQMLEEQEICDESRTALERGEFYVCYQPVYGISAKRFVSAEALVRWNHPTKGMIAPNKFIPVFEKNGFIAELDLYILEQVCIYQKKRMDKGLEPFPISVNISRMSLYNPKLFDIINGLTKRYNVDPKYFRIEITESAYNDNPSQLLETVGRLRGNCYPVLMDDFGSGYSSLNTLKDIPIDILKLDMKFMQGFEKNGKVGTIVTSIARMSKWLNVPMLAEGVETREQYEFLSSIGCSYIQGFYFSRPVPEADFTMLIEQENIIGEGIIQSEERYEIGEDINELLGSNPLVSKFIGSVFGGLGIYELIDGKLELIRANEGYLEIMGYSSNDSLEAGINVWSHVFPEDVDISRNACMEAARTDKAVRARVRRYSKDGRLLVLDGIHRKLGGTEKNPIFCIAFSNITDAIRNDEIIERNADQTVQLLSATGSMFTEVNFKSGTVFRVGSFLPLGVEVDTLDDVKALEKYCSDNVYPDDTAVLRKFYSDTESERLSDELRIKNPDGEYHWWRWTQVRSFDANGSISRVIVIVTSIDAEKNVQLELEQEKASIEAAVNNISTGVMITEVPETGLPVILYSNDGFWNTIGRDRIPNDEFIELVYKTKQTAILREMVKSAKPAETFVTEYSLAHNDGKQVRIEIRACLSHINEHGNSVFLFFVTDITEQYENKAMLSAIIDNYNDGIAFVRKSGGGYSVEYANSSFFRLLALSSDDSVRLALMLSDIIELNVEKRDIRIRKNGDSRIVRTRLTALGKDGYIISVSDVTKKRLELKERISERMEYASAGLYDMVLELNHRLGTVKFVSSRKAFAIPFLDKPIPVERALKGLSEKYVYPADIKRLQAVMEMPFESPDFTDAYREIRFMDSEHGSRYTVYGVTLVRSKPDACMVFCRDKSRVDKMVANSKVADLSRLYRMVAERAKITIIEWDHVTNRTIYSPSLEEYWAFKLSSNEFYKDYRKGLAVHDDDKKAFSEYMENVFRMEAPQTVTVRLKMADESYKWCDITITLTRGENGKIMRSLCIIKQLDRDSAELKRQDKGMDFLRRTVGNIPVGLGIFRLENSKPVPVYISDTIYDIYGLRNRNMDVPVLPMESILKNGTLENGAYGNLTLESMKAEGKRFNLGVQYNVVEEDGETLIYAVLSDVTEQVERRRREATESEMYSMLLFETGTIIFSYDPRSDEFNYRDNNGTKEGVLETISDFTDNSELLTILDENDREKLLRGIQNLRDVQGQYEALVRIDVDGYPRRFKMFMKSVCDENNSVFMIIGKMEDVDDEMSHIEKIEAKAMFDPLCVDVYNKSTTEELIRNELDRGAGGVLMMLDVDDFKSINDTLGHLFGDEFLKKFASTIKGSFRTTDIVGRYGGDEFIVFLPRATASLAKKKAWRILEKISEIDVPKLGSVKSSIGAAVINPLTHSYSEALKQADSALYRAKNNGKNRVELFNGGTMDENSYRAEGSSRRDNSVGLSSNPSGAASMVMRVFSALYSSADTDAGISQMLELVGRTFDVSRAYIFEDIEGGEFCMNTFEWCNEGVEPCIDKLKRVSYQDDLNGEFRECFNDDGIIYCQDIQTLPPVLMGFLDGQNIKSILHCAIKDDDKFKGFVGFDECRSSRFWTQEQIDSLVLISKIISVFLLKGRSKKKELAD